MSTRGSVPKNPSAQYTPLEHVLLGSDDGFQSQFVSATRDAGHAERWARRDPQSAFIAIDLDRLSTPYFDLSDSATRVRVLGDASSAPPGSDIHRANSLARGAEEVLFEGPIPAEAIIGVFR